MIRRSSAPLAIGDSGPSSARITSPEDDLLGRRGQGVAAVVAPAARHEAGALQLEQDALEELRRDLLLRGDRPDVRRGPRRTAPPGGTAPASRTRLAWTASCRLGFGQAAAGARVKNDSTASTERLRRVQRVDPHPQLPPPGQSVGVPAGERAQLVQRELRIGLLLDQQPEVARGSVAAILDASARPARGRPAGRRSAGRSTGSSSRRGRSSRRRSRSRAIMRSASSRRGDVAVADDRDRQRLLEPGDARPVGAARGTSARAVRGCSATASTPSPSQIRPSSR